MNPYLQNILHDITVRITKLEEALAQQCVCGEPNSVGTHRTDGPCLSPQPKRTWVGLTDEEILKCEWAMGANDILLNFAKALEAKLKEKNT